MDTKIHINKISDAIKTAGVSCPSAEDVYNRLNNQIAVIDDEFIDKLLERYNQYQLANRIKNVGKDPKFIGKSDALLSLDDFIFRRMYEHTFPLPEGTFTDAMFGENNFYDLLEEFKTIDAKLKKKQKENVEKYKDILNPPSSDR